MKFGQYLIKKQYSPWEKEYLQYDHLKAIIKDKNQINKVEELKDLLIIEYDKIDQFINIQIQYIHQQLLSLQQNKKNRLILDLHPLFYYFNHFNHFILLSIIGFQKLTKCWQKHGYIQLIFNTWHQLYHYFPTLDHFLMNLANLKQEDDPLSNSSLIRTPSTISHRSSLSSYKSTTESLKSSSIELSTTTTTTTHITSSIKKYYWIHPNHLYELKLYLLYYMNLKEYHDNHITTYFDNDQWCIYNDLLNHPSLMQSGFESMEFSQESTLNNNIKVNHCLNTFISNQNAFKTKYSTIHTTKEEMNDMIHKTIEEKEFQSSKKDLHLKLNQYQWKPKIQYDKQRLIYKSIPNMNIYLDTNIQFKKCNENQKIEFIDWGLLTIEIIKEDKEVKEEEEDHDLKLLPKWLNELIDNCLWLHEVPSFSIYVHGVSVLYPEYHAFLPWWLQWLDEWEMKEEHDSLYYSRSSFTSFLHFHSLFHEKEKEEKKEDDYLLPPPYFLTTKDKKKKKKKGIDQQRHYKIEPKTFFSLERTFLSWLQFCALILTISLNLMNFGNDSISKNCGGLFILLSALLTIYAFMKFLFRSHQLKLIHQPNRNPFYPFDDMYGPAILCILLVLVMLINFGLRIFQPIK